MHGIVDVPDFTTVLANQSRLLGQPDNGKHTSRQRWNSVSWGNCVSGMVHDHSCLADGSGYCTRIAEVANEFCASLGDNSQSPDDADWDSSYVVLGCLGNCRYDWWRWMGRWVNHRRAEEPSVAWSRVYRRPSLGGTTRSHSVMRTLLPDVVVD